MDALLSLPFVGFVNHLLAREEWARERLLPHAGRVVHIRVSPAPALRLRITERGLIEAADADDPALTLTLRAGNLPGLVRQDEAALREIGIEGDTALAADIQFLFRHLRWEVEEDLSRVVGVAAAPRLAQTGRDFMAWQRDAAGRAGENVAEYLQEEARLLVQRADVEAFGRDAATLRDAVERLEKRLLKLEARD